MDNLTFPTVHMNGTSKESLFDSYLEAGHAVAKAIRALEQAAPNGRDYYTQGSVAIHAATWEHNQRVEKLVAVRTELNAICEAIDAQ